MPSVSSPVLLDTSALIWAVEGHERLGPDSRNIADAALGEGRLFVSAISFWEVALLVGRGRMALAYPSSELRQIALGLGLEELPVTGEIGIRAAELDGLPGDSAGRMITATAMAQGRDADHRGCQHPGMERHGGSPRRAHIARGEDQGNLQENLYKNSGVVQLDRPACIKQRAFKVIPCLS
mgnify:CR=1 FL=1